MTRLQTPLYETPGDGGGGGVPTGGGAPTGTTSTAGSVPSAPTAIDLDHDTLVRFKGEEKPFKYGDRIKGLQGQFTRASQEAARYRQQLAERDERLKQFEATQSRAQTQQQTDVYAHLEAMPQVSGKDVAQIVRQFSEQLKQRDAVNLAVLKQLQNTQNIVRNLNGAHSTQAFDAKIGKWLTDGGYPPEAADLAKEIYLAYEGDDLDNEFPTIFQNRWNQIEKILDTRRAAKVAAAKRQPFIPGKGGSAGPSKPLQLDPTKKGRDLGAELWDAMGMGAET